MENVKEIALNQITRSVTNIRKTANPAQMKELTESVKAIGILQPIIVRIIGRDKKEPKDFNTVYELVSGFRRFVAAGEAGLKAIPCVIKELTDDEAAEINVIENLQREDVNAMDEAAGIAALMKTGKNDARAVASKLGKSESYITGRMKLLKLPGEVQKAISSGEISPAHGAVIARLTDIGQQKELLKEIKEEKLSVRAAENQLERYGNWLSDAPFDTADCLKCEHNGTKIKDFFDKDTDLEGRCLNPECLFRKMKEWSEKKKAELIKKGKVLLTLKEANKKLPQGWRYNNNKIDASDKKQLGKKYKEKCDICEKHAFVLDGNEIDELCLNSKCFHAGSKPVAEDKEFQEERNEQRNKNKAAARCSAVMFPAFRDYVLANIDAHALNVLICKTASDDNMGPQKYEDTLIAELWKKTDVALQALTRKLLLSILKDQYSESDLGDLAEGLKFDPVKHLTLNDTYWTACSKSDLLALAKKLGVKDLTESDKRSDMITKVKAAVKPGFVPEDIKKYIKEL